jgi:hypothetical protein
MSFDCDAFISYTHLDNVGRADGTDGWITNLHFALKRKLGELLGEKPNLYFDSRLDGNEVFEITLIDTLKKVAVLVAVVSPRYLKSEWTRREFEEFCKAAEVQGGVLIHDKARVFKVLKTPVPRDEQMPLLSKLLGYEFFWIDPKTGTPHELDQVYGPSAAADYQIKVDDLAYDISTLLGVLKKELGAGSTVATTSTAAKAEKVYLAETTADLKKERDAIRRDLQQHGYTVLPSCALPLVTDELKNAVAEDLAKCRMSIHPIGGAYGLVPEGSDKSLIEIQNEMAIERDEQSSGFVRLLWIPPGKKFEDARQAALADQLRTNPRMQSGADLLETHFEDLMTQIYDRLKKSTAISATTGVAVTAVAQEATTVQAAATTTVVAAVNTAPATQAANATVTAGEKACGTDCGQIYLIHDERDAPGVKPFSDYLFDQGFEVLRPMFKGDEAEVREAHEENLRVCNGALIFYGVTNEAWVRRKLREIQKSVGYGRTGPLPVTSIVSMPPMTDEKQQFRTHDCTVIAAQSEFSAAALAPFLTLVKPGGG